MARRTICKNHGIIEVVPDGMEITPPGIRIVQEPHFIAHGSVALVCPQCGEKTVIERDPVPTKEERAAAKKREVEFYRQKYWSDEYGTGKTQVK